MTAQDLLEDMLKWLEHDSYISYEETQRGEPYTLMCYDKETVEEFIKEIKSVLNSPA